MKFFVGTVRKDSPQDSSTMSTPWTQQRRPFLSHRYSLSLFLSVHYADFTGSFYRSLLYFRHNVPPLIPSLSFPGTIGSLHSRRNFVLNFVLRRLRSRQSPISRPTEIQFKPLITTEAGLLFPAGGSSPPLFSVRPPTQTTPAHSFPFRCYLSSLRQASFSGHCIFPI